MQEIILSKRHDKNAKRLRRNNVIPGILYGKKLGSYMFEIGEMELTNDLAELGENGIFNFNADGYTGTAMIKEVQKDCITRNIIHVDLEEIDMNENITADVPIVFNGKEFLNAKGVVLQTEKDSVKVSCKPEDLPKSIEFNIKSAKIGSVFKLSDLEVGSEISIVDDLNSVLASVSGKQFIFEAEEDIQKN